MTHDKAAEPSCMYSYRVLWGYKHSIILLAIAKDGKIKITTIKEFLSTTALSGNNVEKIQFSIEELET